jgi:hypothetical protein
VTARFTQGSYDGFDYDRMVVRFTVSDNGVAVPCSISTAAMDDMENCKGASASQREAQFMRLRARIEAEVAVKVDKLEFEGMPRGVVLRSIDFRHKS